MSPRLGAAVGVLLLLCPSAAFSQLAPYPDWARSHVMAAREEREKLLPPELSACHERVRRYLWCRLTRWNYWCSLHGCVTERIIAVEPPAGGLDSGLDGVDDISVASAAWLGRESGIFVIVGRRNARSVIRFAVARTRKSRPPGAEYERTTAVLHPQWVFDFPTPIAALDGEVFVRATMFDSTLYVVEGVAPKVIRYVDTDGDRLPDARDPSFSVPLDEGLGINRILGDGFAYVPADAEVVISGGCKGPLSAIEKVGERYAIVPYTRPDHLGYDQMHIDRLVTAGQERVQVESGWKLGEIALDPTDKSRTAVIETAPAANGPWTSASDPTSMAPWTRRVIPLRAPLAEGTFVRATTGRGMTTAPVLVSPKRPVLFSPGIAAGAPGTVVTLSGDNLVPMRGAFRPFDGSKALPVSLALVSKFRLDLTVPDITRTGGFVELDRTDPAAEPLRFLLMIE